MHWDPFLHAWVVTRYPDVVTVLQRSRRTARPRRSRLSAMGFSALNPIAQVMVKQMLFMDAPAHTRLRGLASVALSPARGWRCCATHIQEIAERLLDGRGKRRTHGHDLPISRSRCPRS